MFETGQAFQTTWRASASLGIASSLGLATGVSLAPVSYQANRRNSIHQHFV
jgi:hypothetical protein